MEGEQERGERPRRQSEQYKSSNARDSANKQSLWLVLLCNQTVTRFDILFHSDVLLF